MQQQHLQQQQLQHALQQQTNQQMKEMIEIIKNKITHLKRDKISWISIVSFPYSVS